MSQNDHFYNPDSTVQFFYLAPTIQFFIHQSKAVQLQSKQFMHAPLNFQVSCPTFECRMQRFENNLQRFAPNVPTFRQNVRANLRGRRC